MATIAPTYRPTSDEHREAVRRAEAALLDPGMDHVVEMVLGVEGDVYEAASADGRVRFTACSPLGEGNRFDDPGILGQT